MARFLLFLLSFTAVFFNLAGAKDIYYIGYLGNSTNASSNSLYNALSLTVEAANNSNNAYEVQPVFIDEDGEKAADDINGNGSLLAVLGCFSEKNALLLDKIDKIPLVSVCKNYIAFNEAAKENRFRVCPTEAQLAGDLSRFSITVLEKNKTSIIYSEGSQDYLRAAEAFAANCRANKIWCNDLKSVPADRDDFTAILLRLRDLRIQTIYFAGDWEQAAILIKKSREMNVGADFLSTDAINSRAFIKKAKMEKGFGSACFASAGPENLWAIKEMRPVLAEFRKRFKNEDMYMPYVYDAANLAMKLLAEGKKSGQDMISALKAAEYSGVTGSVRFNRAGIRVNTEPYFYIVRGREVLHRSINDAEGKKYRGAK